MMIVALDAGIEAKTNWIFSSILGIALNGADQYLAEKYISILQDFEKGLTDEIALQDLNTLGSIELEAHYSSIKRTNALFENMHDKFQQKAYFNDKILKGLFKSISSYLNKEEITSYKLLMKNSPVDQAPDYLKTGLFELSNQGIAKKISL